MENYLGYFKKEKTETKVVIKEENPEESYVSFRFYNGSICDLNQKPREIEIRILCPQKDKPKTDVNIVNLPHHISQVLEPVSCEYLIILQSEYLCTLDQFKKKEEKAKNVIDCYPLDGLKITPNPNFLKPKKKKGKTFSKIETKIVSLDLTGNSQPGIPQLSPEKMEEVLKQVSEKLKDIIQKNEKEEEKEPKKM